MARIRTVKPEFYRHEQLQDLEIENPGKYPMLVFQGLWTVCDNQGVFEWKPRQLKLDILPFLPFDIADTLGILERGGMLQRFTADGKEYGWIPTLGTHQRFTGKESGEDGRRYPEPPKAPAGEASEKQQGNNGETSGKQWGSDGETTGKQQGNNGEKPVVPHFPGKEREKEREKEHGKDIPVRVPDPPLLNPRYPEGLKMRDVLRAWDHVPGAPSPGDLFRFEARHGRELLPLLNGLQAEDFLQAIKNYAQVRAMPNTWWKANPDILAWSRKHLDRFLPGNFNPQEYEAESQSNAINWDALLSPTEAKA